MANVFGPKLGLLFNANLDEFYGDNLRKFLQALDQLIMGSVINASTVVPPVSPSPGDAYLISSTPSGAWSGFPVNSIAVWDTQVTLSGTNTQVPAWVNYIPNAGWTVWNVAATSFSIFNGTIWVPFVGGADFPTNTNITSMTGIPHTTLNSTGYEFNDGSRPPTAVGNTALGTNTGDTGFYWGTGGWSSPTVLGHIEIGDGPWSGIPYTGAGVGLISSTNGVTVIGAGAIYTDNLNCTAFQNIGPASQWGILSIGSGAANSYGQINARGTNDVGLSLNPIDITTLQIGIKINANGGGAPHIGLLGFTGNYPTQTTVGAAGGASAPPATPTLWLPIVVGSTEYVFPLYAPA